MSQPTTTKNLAEPIHWYASPGPSILDEFYTLLESPSSAPHSLVPIICSRSESPHLAETLQELIALWMICQEQLKCLRGAQEDSARGASGHGETYCKDQMGELITDFGNVYYEFRRKMEHQEVWLEELGEDAEGEGGVEDRKGGEKEAKRWTEKMDTFFEAGDWDPEARSEGGRERTEEEKSDQRYWRKELLEEWGVDVLSPENEEVLYQDHFVNVRVSGGA